MHGCTAYQAMSPHSVFVRASPRSDDLLDWQLLRVFPGSHLGFFGFSSHRNQIQGEGVNLYWSIAPSVKLRCTPTPGTWGALLLLWSRCIFLVCLSWKPHLAWLRENIVLHPFQKTVRKGDECILKDNNERSKWLVTGPGGVDMLVPSVSLIIPPPNPLAVDLATKWVAAWVWTLAMGIRVHSK